MGGLDLSQLTWRKSTRSGSTGGNCVEIAALPAAVVVRDSKDQTGPVLMFEPAAWASFVGAARTSQPDRN
jgi:hypothetical protein